MSEVFKAFTEDEVRAACAMFGVDPEDALIVVSANQFEANAWRTLVYYSSFVEMLPDDMIIVKKNKEEEWDGLLDDLGIPVHYDQRWTRSVDSDLATTFTKGDSVRVDRVPTKKEQYGGHYDKHQSCVGAMLKIDYVHTPAGVYHGYCKVTFEGTALWFPSACLSLVRGQEWTTGKTEYDKAPMKHNWTGKPAMGGSNPGTEEHHPDGLPVYTYSAVFQDVDGAELASPEPGDGWEMEHTDDYRRSFDCLEVAYRDGTEAVFDVGDGELRVTHPVGASWVCEILAPYTDLRCLEVTKWRRKAVAEPVVESYVVSDQLLAKYLS